jgi:hypothetical protein
MERDAQTLYDLCGPLVTECEAAHDCSGDSSCTISYCEVDTHESDPWFIRVFFGLFDEVTECETIPNTEQTEQEYTL